MNQPPKNRKESARRIYTAQAVARPLLVEILEPRHLMSINITGNWSGTDTQGSQTVPMVGSWQQTGDSISGSFEIGPFANGYSGPASYGGTLNGLMFEDYPPGTLNPSMGNETTNAFTISADGNSMTGTTIDYGNAGQVYTGGSGGVPEDIYSLTRDTSDLKGTITTQPPSKVDAGDDAVVAFNLKNIGADEASGSYSIAFDLETAPSTGNGDLSVGSSSGSIDLDAGASSDPISSSITVPEDTAPGTYYIVGTLTDGDGITDTDTSDKTFDSTPITIISATDLSGAFTKQPPAVMSSGDSAPIAYTLTNSGPDAATGSYSLEFDLQDDSGTDLGAVGSASGSVSLGAGDSTDAINAAIKLPENLDPGTYTVVATLTDSLSPTDTDTSDKTFSSTPITVASDALQFVDQPEDTNVLHKIEPVTVELVDPQGKRVRGEDSDVALSVASGPAGAVLGGTTTAELKNGIATFRNLRIDTAGTYTLSATDSDDTTATSDSFDMLKSFKISVNLKSFTTPWTSYVNGLTDAWGNFTNLLKSSPGFSFSGLEPGELETEGDISGEVECNSETLSPASVVSGSVGVEASASDDVLLAGGYWGLPFGVFEVGLEGKLGADVAVHGKVEWKDGEPEYSVGAKGAGKVIVEGHALLIPYKGALAATGAVEIPADPGLDGQITGTIEANFGVEGSMQYKKGKKYTKLASISKDFGRTELGTYQVSLSQIVDAIFPSDF